MPVVYAIIGAASNNYMHASSSENYNVKRYWLPRLLQRFAQGDFQHAESKFAIRFVLCQLQQYKLLVYQTRYALHPASCL